MKALIFIADFRIGVLIGVVVVLSYRVYLKDSISDGIKVVKNHANSTVYRVVQDMCQSFDTFIQVGIICLCDFYHMISDSVVCATSKASDQPTHTRSLIRAFFCRLNII